jgi:hypothetical protein
MLMTIFHFLFLLARTVEVLVSKIYSTESVFPVDLNSRHEYYMFSG